MRGRKIATAVCSGRKRMNHQYYVEESKEKTRSKRRRRRRRRRRSNGFISLPTGDRTAIAVTVCIRRTFVEGSY